MFHDTTFPPPDGRLAALMREFSALDRTSIEAAIDAMIARLDQADGDPDLEPSGDEHDASAMQGWNFTRAPRASLDHEDAEDDDSDQCSARDDHVGLPVSCADSLAGDPDDAEDEPDRCEAGDDMMLAGPVLDRGRWLAADPAYSWFDRRPGCDEDAERNEPPAYSLDQRADLFVTPASDWPEMAA